MELVDYIRHRLWLFCFVAVGGLIVIAAVAMTANAGGYRAGADLLVLPPAGDSNTYNAQLERYVNTEMKLLTTPAVLTATADESPLSAEELARSLDVRSSPLSDVVTLTITDSDPEVAVTSVNAVAEAYLGDARRRASSAADLSAAELQERISKIQQQLVSTNRQISAASERYIVDNPDSGVPGPATVAPQAYSRQILLTNRLQQLGQVQTELTLSSSVEIRSRVVRPATTAQQLPQFSVTTWLAALVGLVLVLLALAALGVTFSSRIFGPSRWTRLAQRAGVGSAITLRNLRAADRRQTVDRVKARLAPSHSQDRDIILSSMPAKSSCIKGRARFVVEALPAGRLLADEPMSIYEAASVLEARAPVHGSETQRILLFVDSKQARVPDAEDLGGLSEVVRRRIITVLVR